MKNKTKNESVDGLSMTSNHEVINRMISFKVTEKEYSKWAQLNNVLKRDWFTVAECGIDRIGIKAKSGFSLMNFRHDTKWESYQISIVPLIPVE